MTHARLTPRLRLRRLVAATSAALCAVVITSGVAAGTSLQTTAAGTAPAAKPLPRPHWIWSGYVGRGRGPYTAAGGQFTIPAIKCTDPLGSLSLWVGLDGQDDLLPQAGLAYDCKGLGSRPPGWYAFYEIAAQDEFMIPFKSDPATHPLVRGDVVSVDVYEQASGSTRGYVFEVENQTRAWVLRTWEALAPQNQKFVADTADWILEAAPRLNLKKGWIIYPLPNFGTVRFDQCDASTAKVEDGTAGSNPTVFQVSLTDHKTTIDGGQNLNRADSLAGALQTATDGTTLSAFTMTWRAPK